MNMTDYLNIYILRIISLFIINGIALSFVTTNQAYNVADNFIKSKRSDFETYNIESYFLDSTNNIDNFYIFNLDPSGFIIISAQKNIIPVIAYSFSKDINFENLPLQLESVIDSYRKNIHNAYLNNLESNTYINNLWNNYINGINIDRDLRNVDPMITANWDQGGQWNNQCPGNTPVGCVAVAMGQVMYYWKHPVEGVGYSQYYEPDFGPIAVNFEDFTYNFDNMLDNQATEDSQLLLYHAGVSVNMDYNYSGSGASVCWEDPSSQYALDYHFSFIDDINCEPKLNYDDEGWSNLLKEQLDNGWPIIYRGYAENEGPGHAWNIDGYQDEYLHCNWGWGGSANGYFYFNNLNGQGFSFVESQAALINIFPEGIDFPVALFDYSIDNFTVYFNDISSQINGNEIISWIWDFDDGTYSNEISPVHIFSDHGVYNVSLIISDNYGQDSEPHLEIINLLIGDINSDLSVNIVDVITLVSLIINTPNTYNSDADLNGDGLLSVLDIIALINIILS